MTILPTHVDTEHLNAQVAAAGDDKIAVTGQHTCMVILPAISWAWVDTGCRIADLSPGLASRRRQLFHLPACRTLG